MKALIVGASGLIGSQLLKKLLTSSNYESIICVGRKKIEIQHPKLKQIILELDALKNNSEILIADDYFCCLGTTIKIAKTKENFKKVDFEAPLALVEIAKKNNANGFYIGSSIGGYAQIGVVYKSVKGPLEI